MNSMIDSKLAIKAEAEAEAATKKTGCPQQ